MGTTYSAANSQLISIFENRIYLFDFNKKPSIIPFHDKILFHLLETRSRFDFAKFSKSLGRMNIFKALYRQFKIMINDSNLEEEKDKVEEKEMLEEIKDERVRIIEIFTIAKLTKQRRNEIFDMIIRYGFTPDEFFIDEIEHNRSEHFFSIGFYYEEAREYEFNIALDLRRPDEYMVVARPIVNRMQVTSKGDWAYVIKFFANWLATIKEDVQLEEKWHRLEMPDWEFELSDGKFDTKELELISHKLEVLNDQFNNLDISDEIFEDLEEILTELKEQSDSLSKVNWQRLFVGAIINTITKFSIPKEQANQIWICIRNTFKKLL